MTLYILIVKRVSLKGVAKKWSILFQTFDQKAATERLSLAETHNPRGEPRLITHDIPLDLATGTLRS